jgi:hypothetical protein
VNEVPPSLLRVTIIIIIAALPFPLSAISNLPSSTFPVGVAFCLRVTARMSRRNTRLENKPKLREKENVKAKGRVVAAAAVYINRFKRVRRLGVASSGVVFHWFGVIGAACVCALCVCFSAL